MASLARTQFDDRPRPSSPVAGVLHLLARAANDNAPSAILTSTTDDAAGRPANLSNARTGSYGWDNAGNLQTLGYPDGTTVITYQYDPLKRTTKALIGTTSYGTLTYDALGRRQKLSFLGGTSQTWSYDNADRVTSIAHVFPNRTTDNVTYTCGGACPRAGRRPDPGDPSGRDASRTIDNVAYQYNPTAASTTYGTANALNQYPSVGGYAYSYWAEGGLDETNKLQANYDEFGKLTLAYITVTPGTVDPNDFDFMGVDALDHVYYHGRQTTAGDTHPFIYHDTDGLRPETIRDTQCTQTGGGVTTCTGTGTGTRLYVLGPDPDERWSFLDMDGTVDSPHTDREGTLIWSGPQE
jgi:hypothetical protein